MLYLKILSIAIPYLVLSYFAWEDYKYNKDKLFYPRIITILWRIISAFIYFFYLLWLFGDFK